LVIPVTDATSEHSFSALKRVKTYLRNTVGQERLNSHMVLHVHKELADELNFKDVANEFVSQCKSRLTLNGWFL